MVSHKNTPCHEDQQRQLMIFSSGPDIQGFEVRPEKAKTLFPGDRVGFSYSARAVRPYWTLLRGQSW